MDWSEFERVQQVVDRRLLLKMKSVMINPAHPLHAPEVINTSTFSQRDCTKTLVMLVIGCFMYLYRRILLGIVIVLLFRICGVISVLNLPGQCNFLLRINHGYICLCF